MSKLPSVIVITSDECDSLFDEFFPKVKFSIENNIITKTENGQKNFAFVCKWKKGMTQHSKLKACKLRELWVSGRVEIDEMPMGYREIIPLIKYIG